MDGPLLAIDYPTVFRSGNSAPVSSGIAKKRPAAAKKRPPRRARLQSKRELEWKDPNMGEQRDVKQLMGSKKRKCVVEEIEAEQTNKAVCLKVVPSEGLPNAQ